MESLWRSSARIVTRALRACVSASGWSSASDDALEADDLLGSYAQASKLYGKALELWPGEGAHIQPG